jgi:tetratricopeptide (TPR) repeat protein
LGDLADAQGSYEQAMALYEKSLNLAAELGDRRRQAIVLNSLGRLAHRSGDEGRALALFNKSLALRRDLGDTRGVAVSLKNLGQVTQQLDNLN